MWSNARQNVRQVAPSPPVSPPPPYKSRQNSPLSNTGRPVQKQPDRNVYYGNAPKKERHIGKAGGNVRGGKCGECCLGVCCCAGGPACCPFPGRDKNQEGCCKNGCCRGPCIWGCCAGEGVFPHLDPNTPRGKGVPGTCCGAPYESLNDTHKPRRCRRIGAIVLFMLLPLLLGLIGLGVYFGLQAAQTSGTKDSIEEQAPGGYYQDGVYFYPVPQENVDQYYRVIGQEEIDDCWDFLEEIGVTITTTINGTITTTTPVTTVGTTMAATTEAATTDAPTTVAITEAVTTVVETTGTVGTGTEPTMVYTTVEATTTGMVEMTTVAVTTEMTTVVQMSTTTSYMGTIPNCYALTTMLENMNTPMLISGATKVRIQGQMILLVILVMLLLR